MRQRKSYSLSADLSDVRVTADISEKDIPFIYHDEAKPQSVEVRVLAYPKEVFEGQITYMSDVLDRVTRTMRLRELKCRILIDC